MVAARFGSVTAILMSWIDSVESFPNEVIARPSSPGGARSARQLQAQVPAPRIGDGNPHQIEAERRIRSALDAISVPGCVTFPVLRRMVEGAVGSGLLPDRHLPRQLSEAGGNDAA